MIAPPVPRVKSRFSSAFIKERNQVATKKAGFFQLTNEQRKRRHMTDVNTCPRCKKAEKTIMHALALKDCETIKPIWLRMVNPHKWSVFFSMGLRQWYKRVLVSSNDWQSGDRLGKAISLLFSLSIVSNFSSNAKRKVRAARELCL